MLDKQSRERIISRYFTERNWMPRSAVDDQPGPNIPVCECHAERVNCEVLRHRSVELPPYDGHGIEIHYRGQVQPAPINPDIGDIRDPLLVRALCTEAATQEVVFDVDHRRAGRTIMGAFAITSSNAA